MEHPSAGRRVAGVGIKLEIMISDSHLITALRTDTETGKKEGKVI